MQYAWEERVDAREEMNQEYEKMQTLSDRYREVWDEYEEFRSRTGSRIDDLRREADNEHYEMKWCFDRASDEYEYGDRAMASTYSQEGHEHKEHRDELNAEISDLIQEIRDAKESAKYRAPRTDNSDFKHAKAQFEQAKARHESAQAEFKRLKTERDRLKAAFEAAQSEHVRLKTEFQRKLEEVKAENQRKRDKVLDLAGIRWADRKDAKIVEKADGTTQVYSGGLSGGDSIGHGHVALDQSGRKTYDREAFAAHGSQNYTEEGSGWTPREWGIIGNDHEVTFRQGIGVYEGQTLISDGHVNKRQFDRAHNHYGKNNKALYPDGPDFVEDSDKHMGDNFYTGPGH